MDKNFLGLGVIFNAIDKGLDKSLTEVTTGFDKANQALQQVERSANAGAKGKGGVFSGVIEGFKLLSIAKIGSTISSIGDALAGTKGTINDTFKTLDTLQARISQALDPEVAAKFNKSLLQTMKTSGLSADETRRMATGMMEYGRATEDTLKTLPMMGDLVGKLGLGTENVTKLFGQGMAFLRATPKQMTDLIKATVKMQKAYRLTDLVAPLPEIFDSVTKNAARYGKIQAATAIESAKSVTGLVAVFQKVGKSQREAISSAIGFNDKLGDMKRSILDMQVGLSPMDESIFEFAEALTLAGIDGADAMRMIMEGAENPEKLMNDIRGQLAGLDEGTKRAVTARLRRIFGDDLANLVGTYAEEVEGAVSAADEQQKKLGTGAEEFSKMTGALTNTMEVQERLTASAKTFFDLSLKFANKKVYIEALQAQRAAWDSMSVSIMGTNTALGSVLKKLDVLKEVGLVGIFTSLAPLSALLDLLGAFVFPLTSLIGLMTIFRGPLKMVLGLFSGIASAGGNLLKNVIFGLLKGMGFLTGMAAKLFSAMGGLSGIFGLVARGVGTVFGLFAKLSSLGGVLIKGMIMFAGVISGAVVNALVAVGTAIMATPIGWIIAGIVAIGAAIFLLITYWDEIKSAMSGFFGWAGDALSSFGSTLYGILIEPWDNFFGWVFGRLSSFGEYVGGVFGGIGDSIVSTFRGVAGFFGEMMSKLWDFIPTPIQKLLSGEFEVFNKVTGFIGGLVGDVKGLLFRGEKKPENLSQIAKILPFQRSEDKDGDRTTFGAPPSVAMPTMRQEGAPERAPVGVAIPATERPGTAGDFDKMIDAIVDMKLEMIKALGGISERPIRVDIHGDARKMFTAQSRRAMGEAGELGIASSVGR